MDTKNQGIYQSNGESIIKDQSSKSCTLKEFRKQGKEGVYLNNILNTSIKQES